MGHKRAASSLTIIDLTNDDEERPEGFRLTSPATVATFNLTNNASRQLINPIRAKNLITSGSSSYIWSERHYESVQWSQSTAHSNEVPRKNIANTAAKRRRKTHEVNFAGGRVQPVLSELHVSEGHVSDYPSRSSLANLACKVQGKQQEKPLHRPGPESVNEVGRNRPYYHIDHILRTQILRPIKKALQKRGRHRSLVRAQICKHTARRMVTEVRALATSIEDHPITLSSSNEAEHIGIQPDFQRSPRVSNPKTEAPRNVLHTRTKSGIGHCSKLFSSFPSPRSRELEIPASGNEPLHNRSVEEPEYSRGSTEEVRHPLQPSQLMTVSDRTGIVIARGKDHGETSVHARCKPSGRFIALRSSDLASALKSRDTRVVQREDARLGLRIVRHRLSISDKHALRGRQLRDNSNYNDAPRFRHSRFAMYDDSDPTPVNSLDWLGMLSNPHIPASLVPGSFKSTMQHSLPVTANACGVNDVAESSQDLLGCQSGKSSSRAWFDCQARFHRAPNRIPIASVLRQREVQGVLPKRLASGQRSIKAELKSYWEDDLAPEHVWTDCCGDISAINWTSGQAFVCGAIAHSDPHNMQYNKPGNLLLGSYEAGTLRSIADHRTVRLSLDSRANVENASESMRRTQSPWLYASVVAIAYCQFTGFTFTASFDHTVKVWSVAQDGSGMGLYGSWSHPAKVNFVVASKFHGMIATASDVQHDAVRVYRFNEHHIDQSGYDLYTCDRAYEQARELANFGNWAYFPATIQWGRAQVVAHLLLVGFSPRSITEDDSEIENEVSNTGELALWNTLDRSRVTIISANAQNVFEVLWHPSQAVFIAATAPCGIFEAETKTQIRLFARQVDRSFASVKVLDCPAYDINELTLMPNSFSSCFATASCTDGNTYVWDTATSEKPIHILSHGDSLDNPRYDLPRDIADTGVKFAAWGGTCARFYTGSSDGKVKAWDIEAPPGRAFVRDVFTAAGGITVGSFSWEITKLALGDATGKVHMLALANEIAQVPASSARQFPRIPSAHGFESISHSFLSKLPLQNVKPILHHPEPLPPVDDDDEVGQAKMALALARTYIEEGQLSLIGQPNIGVVQGPNYAETRLYCKDAHEGGDVTKALLPNWQAVQQFERLVRRDRLNLSFLPIMRASDTAAHYRNTSMDLDVKALALSSCQLRKEDQIDLQFEFDESFDFEPGGLSGIFKIRTSPASKTANQCNHHVQ